MNFWSKGLGQRKIDFYLGKGEAIKGVDWLYVKGQMEAPVSWEYIVRLRDEDLVDFFALLREPAMADYVYRSPERWHLIRGLLFGGLRLAWTILATTLRRLLRNETEIEDVEIQVPPALPRKRARAVRRRLGSRLSPGADDTPSDPDPEPSGVANDGVTRG